MRPVRGVVHLAVEGIQPVDRRDVRVRQRADREDHETRRHHFACIGAHFPPQRVLIENRVGDAGTEGDIGPQVVAIGDVVEVTQNFRLGGVLLAPVPLLLESVVEGVRVVHTFDVTPRPRVAVPVPHAADPVRGLEQPHGQPVAAQPVQSVEAGEPRAYHDCVDVPTHSADGTGRTATRMPIVPLCGNCHPAAAPGVVA